jgi:hypothetical protein
MLALLASAAALRGASTQPVATSCPDARTASGGQPVTQFEPTAVGGREDAFAASCGPVTLNGREFSFGINLSPGDREPVSLTYTVPPPPQGSGGWQALHLFAGVSEGIRPTGCASRGFSLSLSAVGEDPNGAERSLMSTDGRITADEIRLIILPLRHWTSPDAPPTRIRMTAYSGANGWSSRRACDTAVLAQSEWVTNIRDLNALIGRRTR